MQNFNRRNLLRGVAIFPLALGMGLSLEACQTVQNVSDLTTKALAVVNGLSTIVGPVTSIIGVGSSVVSTVSAVIADLKAAASMIGSTSSGVAQTAVQKFDAGLAAVTSAVSTVLAKLPSVSSIIADATTVVNSMKAAVGLPSPPAGPGPLAAEAAVARLQAAR